ncbi:alpha-ketoglutarate-dependent dioxygenase AlkB [Catenovulum sp. 2E275]|uniref:alpha-ketoglutarate-dependent dioxygenase AlkB family protein n=1 Tax=Catenovulum sp. 2E275 TaxID=2980497 RepID=UPI0021D3B3E8|nr:alpha-ketoglutarate-dependent dioxygenase AlkB [Catenovulum sp. 2E275]MCU4674911.1 alpha-ketoglutarate-dependent dioxygenase AlkB [Catenovulum sp. 2E275]
MFNQSVLPQALPLKNAQIYYFENLLNEQMAGLWYQALKNTLSWQQEKLVVYGQEHAIPRLQALYGDKGLSYQYSKKRFEVTPWLDNLLQLKMLAEQVSQAQFNCVLANFYRNGQDCMGWHADDEAELGKSPVIASFSFGAQRTFKLKHRLTQETYDLELASGSLLIMAGTTQEFWYHSLPKRAKVTEGRINLTFRYLYADKIFPV